MDAIVERKLAAGLVVGAIAAIMVYLASGSLTSTMIASVSAFVIVYLVLALLQRKHADKDPWPVALGLFVAPTTAGITHLTKDIGSIWCEFARAWHLLRDSPSGTSVASCASAAFSERKDEAFWLMAAGATACIVVLMLSYFRQRFLVEPPPISARDIDKRTTDSFSDGRMLFCDWNGYERLAIHLSQPASEALIWTKNSSPLDSKHWEQWSVTFHDLAKRCGAIFTRSWRRDLAYCLSSLLGRSYLEPTDIRFRKFNVRDSNKKKRIVIFPDEKEVQRYVLAHQGKSTAAGGPSADAIRRRVNAFERAHNQHRTSALRFSTRGLFQAYLEKIALRDNLLVQHDLSRGLSAHLLIDLDIGCVLARGDLESRDGTIFHTPFTGPEERAEPLRHVFVYKRKFKTFGIYRQPLLPIKRTVDLMQALVEELLLRDPEVLYPSAEALLRALQDRKTPPPL